MKISLKKEQNMYIKNVSGLDTGRYLE